MSNSFDPFLSPLSVGGSSRSAMSSASDNRSIDDLRRDIDYGKNQLKQLDSNSREYFKVEQGIQQASKIYQEKLVSSHKRGDDLYNSTASVSNPPTSWSNVNQPPQNCATGYNTLPPISHLQNLHPFGGFEKYANPPNGLFSHDGGSSITSGSFTNQFLQDPSEDLFVPQSSATGEPHAPSSFQPGDITASPLAHRAAASNKRPQHRLSSPWEEEQASKRPSPSPVVFPGSTGPSPPSSMIEGYEDSMLMEALGVHAKEDWEEVVRAQREVEEANEKRKKRERDDELWARQYQQSDTFECSRPSSGHPELYSSPTQPSLSSQTSAGSPLPNGKHSSAPFRMKQEAGHNGGNVPNLHERSQKPAFNSPLGSAEVIDLLDSDDDEVGGNPSAHLHPSSARYTTLPNHPSAGPSSSADQVPGTGGTSVYSFANGHGTSSGQVKTEQGLLGTINQGLVIGAQGVYNTANSFLRNASEHILANGHTYANGLKGSFDSPLLVDGMGSLDHMSSHQREMYEDLRENLRRDPVNTANEINTLLANIRPDEDIPPQDRTGTPASLSRTSALYEHQKLGLAWMVAQELGTNKGGILADDMGLGKTVQALALMVSRKSENPQCKTNLIVAPVGLLKQWEREISVRLRQEREHRLKTFIYHGSTIKTPYDELKQYDVVLTSFGTLASEMKRKDEQEDKSNADPNWRPGPGDVLPLLGATSKWYRVILDEAQNIKNKGTRAAKATYSLQSRYRFCLTGTPMMNDIKELHSLIHFLRIKPYNLAENFNATFVVPLKGTSISAKETAMRRLRALLKAILLRRTKKSLIDGKPIIALPERITEVVHTVFSPDEDSFYRSLEARTALTFNKYLAAGTVGKNYSNVLVLLLRLRQACCHPHLIKNHAEPGTSSDAPPETTVANAQSLAPEVVKRIIEQGALDCPICMDAAENAIIFVPCGHGTCSECYAQISDPARAEREGVSGGFKCPNDRSIIRFGSVTDYATFKKVHMPSPEDEADAVDLPGFGEEDDDAAESESETDSEDDSDEDPTLDGFIVPDDVEFDDDATASEDDNDSESSANKRKAKALKKASKKIKKSKRQAKGKKGVKGQDATKIRLKNMSFAELKKESLKSVKARRYYLKRIAKEWVTSAKIEKTLEILRGIIARGNEKTIIFSQFTSLLDLLEIPIAKEDWGYRRFDGSMSSVQRNHAVIEFADNPDVRILLVSLKAGNSGLNLTAASQVILFDPFWNPYIEEQAIDRAHRIGQRLPVQVHRVLVPNTVEDRIIELQEKKRAIIEGALDENAAREVGRLGERELAYLFGVSGDTRGRR